MNIQDYLDTFTIIACTVIAGAFVIAWIYIATSNSTKLRKRRKWLEQLPSVIATLGVLGTFLGITKGLLSFDTNDLDTSIPLLLDGLKTAFFTSLLGMFGSLILNRVVSHKLDKEMKGSEAENAAQLIVDRLNTSIMRHCAEMRELTKHIVDTLNTNHNALPTILNDSNKGLVEALSENENMMAIRVDVQQLKDDIEEIKGHIEELKGQNGEVIDILKSIESASSSSAEELPRLRAVAVTATASIATIDNNVEELHTSLSSIDDKTSEINANLETIKTKKEGF